MIAQANYAYDPVGNRTTLTDLAGDHSFTYDALSRLTGAIHPAPSGLVPEGFVYDPVGNRTRSHLSTTHVYDAANRLFEDDAFTYTYDANGNRQTKTDKLTGATTTYTYDVDNQLVTLHSPLVTAQYRYDALGRRIEKTVNGTATRFRYDQEDLLLETTQSGTLRARWTHGPGLDEPLLMERDRNTNGTFEATERVTYHADGLGSIVALTGSSGQVVERYTYDSFGTPRLTGPGPDGQMDTPDDVTLTQSAFGNPYLFTGREYDPESGLYFYRARYYDPRTGRFLQEDPIGGDGVHPTQHRMSMPGVTPSRTSTPWACMGRTVASTTGSGVLRRVGRTTVFRRRLRVRASSTIQIQTRSEMMTLRVGLAASGSVYKIAMLRMLEEQYGKIGAVLNRVGLLGRMAH